MLKALSGAAALAGILVALALAATGAHGQTANPCTPHNAGANFCSVVTVDPATGVTSRVAARFNGTCDANGNPVFVATTNPVWGGIDVGANRAHFQAPSNADQSALDGRVLRYSVDVRQGNTTATIPYTTKPTDSASVSFQGSDVSLTFVNLNNVAGEDVPETVTRSAFQINGTVEMESVKDSRPVPNC